MEFRLSYRAYRRAFRRPLLTARGEWAFREGFILCGESSGRRAFGEIAPIPSFGSESIEQASAMLDELVKDPDLEIPDSFPSCAFALSGIKSALRKKSSGAESRGISQSYLVAGLLPAGGAAIESASAKMASGYEALKWKIGVGPTDEELSIAAQLFERLAPGVKLRIDANGGLSREEMEQWLGFLSPVREQIEFIEQPLAVGFESEMAEASAASGVPIALDESLNAAEGRRWLKAAAWSGPLVIKPLLMGSVEVLEASLRPLAKQLVFSSVFESSVGLRQVVGLLEALPQSPYALGFDTFDCFDDNLSVDSAGPIFPLQPIFQTDLDALWNLLPHSS